MVRCRRYQNGENRPVILVGGQEHSRGPSRGWVDVDDQFVEAVGFDLQGLADVTGSRLDVQLFRASKAEFVEKRRCVGAAAHGVDNQVGPQVMAGCAVIAGDRHTGDASMISRYGQFGDFGAIEDVNVFEGFDPASDGGFQQRPAGK